MQYLELIFNSYEKYILDRHRASDAVPDTYAIVDPDPVRDLATEAKNRDTTLDRFHARDSGNLWNYYVIMTSLFVYES